MSREDAVRIIRLVEEGLASGLSASAAIDYAAIEDGRGKDFISRAVGIPGWPGITWSKHGLGVTWS